MSQQIFIVKNNNIWTSQANWFLENHSHPYLVMTLFSPGHHKISEKIYIFLHVFFFFLLSVTVLHQKEKFRRLIWHLKWTGTEQVTSVVKYLDCTIADGSTNVFL